MQGHDEGVAGKGQHGAFCFRMVDLFTFDDVGFVQDLHGIQRARIFLSHQHHFPKTPFPDHLGQFKGVQFNLANVVLPVPRHRSSVGGGIVFGVLFFHRMQPFDFSVFHGFWVHFQFFRFTVRPQR